ncbi:HDR127Cp [Eremothecium sinecaudum]|uniref:HDR127Cp n=1 Tax=Eremothecium sinecaudum TaxID=45286 RepID=A0A0X8HSY1_9SACH|nr:HDR127Cp [Eremothecium sinecaudum]AMD20869.1 HDR127Cp [Eremothecium sinecaudum]
MSFNSVPSNQLYGGRRYSSGYSGVTMTEEGPRNGAGRYRKRKYQSAEPDDDITFELGKNKRATVRQFRNINLVDIREYYQDTATGEMKPGKKGISLTEEQYDELLHHQFQIDEALRRFGSKRRKFKMVPVDHSDDEGGAMKEIEPNRRQRAKSSDPGKSEAREHAKPATKKRKVAEPQRPYSQQQEENPRLDLAIPTMKKALQNPRLDDRPKKVEPKPKIEVQAREDEDLDSSDEDFAQALESEVRRQDEDISEEE